ncbi:RHO1 GDP-GTP exchange protein 2, partial [Coemansia sp. RSA 552]
MAAVPRTQNRSGAGSSAGGGASGSSNSNNNNNNNASAHGRKHKGSSLTSWLKKGTAASSTSSSGADAKKLASPAEEIKMVFLRQLKLSSLELDGKHYHSVFTGAQIVDIILDHFKLPDRTLATNVASRMIDCSLYTHVSGPSVEPGAGGPVHSAAVIDSNAEIYTLTAEARALLKSIKYRNGDSLHRAKTQTRKHYRDFRSHLHPRSSDSQHSSNSGSLHSSHRTRGSISSRATSPGSSSNHVQTEPSSPPVPAPLDVQRAREMSMRVRRPRSLAESVASSHGGAGRSADSPSETLVSHGPLNANRTSDPGQQRCLSDGSLLTAAVDHPEQSSMPSIQLQGVDIPTGDLGSLLNTWTFVAETPTAPSAGSKDMADNASSTRHSSSDLPESGSKRGSGSTLDQVDQNRLSMGVDGSTAGSSNGDDDAAVVLPEPLLRMSRVSSMDWPSLGRAFVWQNRWAAMDVELNSQQQAKRASSASDHTINRRSSIPSLYDPLTALPQSSSSKGGDSLIGTRQPGPQAVHSFDDDWLADIGVRARQSRCSRYSRHSELVTEGQLTASAYLTGCFDWSMNSLATSRATSEYIPYGSGVQLQRNSPVDGPAYASWNRSHARRHSTGTQAFIPGALSEYGSSALHMLTPTTHRSSIAASETVDTVDDVSRSSMYLPSLSDAFPSDSGDIGRSEAGSADRAPSSAGVKLSETSIALSSIPNFPRPRYPASLVSRRSEVSFADTDSAQGSAMPMPVSTDQRHKREDAGSIRSTHHSKLMKGKSLRRRHISPGPLTAVAAASGAAGGSSSDTSERLSSTTTPSTPHEDKLVRLRTSKDKLAGMHRQEEVLASRRISCNMQLQLWRDTVSPLLLQTLSQETIAQQEAIFEIVSTEQGYLRDLELIDTVFVDPLLQGKVMPRPRASEFVQVLFYNYRDLIANSRELCASLVRRREEADSPVIQEMGDIFDEWASRLSVFIEYAVHVPEAQCELEAELLQNERMAQFLSEAEAEPQSRRLPVQSFIGRPATRFARYPLLLNAIIKRTTDSSEIQRLQSAVDKVKAALEEVDRLTGEASERLRIRQISQRLRLVSGARDSLALDSPSRQLIREGVLYSGDSSQVLVFLFDNSLIMAVEEKVTYAKGITRYVADERIIPISMLDVSVPVAETSALTGIREVLGLQSSAASATGTAASSSLARPGLLRDSASSASVKGRTSTNGSSTGGGASMGASSGASGGSVSGASPSRQPLSFVHIGCQSLSRTLLVSSEAERDQWVAAVSQRVCIPQTLVEAYTDARMLSDRDFVHGRAPLCSAPFVSLLSGCQMVLFGNKDGLHMGIYGVPTSVVRVSHVGNVSKIQIMKRYNMVIALSDSNLLVFSLSEIEKATAQVGAGVSGTRIASSVGFFDIGSYMGSPLVVLMKPRGSRSHFKCILPQLNP